MAEGVAIGTSGGNEAISSITLGTASGNATVTAAYLGTANGNVQVYSTASPPPPSGPSVDSFSGTMPPNASGDRQGIYYSGFNPQSFSISQTGGSGVTAQIVGVDTTNDIVIVSFSSGASGSFTGKLIGNAINGVAYSGAISMTVS